jgi:hypothetical protein
MEKLLGRENSRLDIEFRAANVRNQIEKCRQLGDTEGVRDLNRTLTAICGEAETFMQAEPGAGSPGSWPEPDLSF